MSDVVGRVTPPGDKLAGATVEEGAILTFVGMDGCAERVVCCKGSDHCSRC